MAARHSTVFFGAMASLCRAAAGLLVHAVYETRSAERRIAANAALVRRLELTDLCVFTEARYTRNPGVTDYASAFQDGPLSLEHFPSGALLQPPSHLLKR